MTGWLRAFLGLFAFWVRRLADLLDRVASIPVTAAGAEWLAAARQRYPGAPDHWLQTVAAHLDDAVGMDAPPEEVTPPEAVPIPQARPEIGWFTSAGARPAFPQPSARRGTAKRTHLRFPVPGRARAVDQRQAAPAQPSKKQMASFASPAKPDSSPPAFDHDESPAGIKLRFAGESRRSYPPLHPADVLRMSERATSVFPALPEAMTSVADAGSQANIAPRRVPTDLAVPDRAVGTSPVWPAARQPAHGEPVFGPAAPLAAWPPLPPNGTAMQEVLPPPLPDLRREQWFGQWNG
jgi:hypothetical protein